jgi:hypothetical protein
MNNLNDDDLYPNFPEHDELEYLQERNFGTYLPVQNLKNSIVFYSDEYNHFQIRNNLYIIGFYHSAEDAYVLRLSDNCGISFADELHDVINMKYIDDEARYDFRFNDTELFSIIERKFKLRSFM